MANILNEEKRAVGIGEVCAISLNHIRALHIALNNYPDPEDNDICFFSDERNGISSEDEITFVKYVGNGMFMDLISDQLLITELFGEDEIGSDEYNMMDIESQEELTRMSNFWCSLYAPKNKLEFSESFSVFMQNPLVIDIQDEPFMSINSENAKKFASQSLEQVKSKIMSAKTKTQQELKEQYSKYEGKIEEIYSAKERKSISKSM